MGLYHSPRIITDGLVLCLDAANVKSYPGSGTTWTDLVGNNVGMLTNGPTFDSGNGGSIVFDGVDDYVILSGSYTLSTATFVVWIKRNGTQNAYDGIFFSRGTGSNVTGINFFSSGTTLGYHWNAAAATYNWNSGLIIPDVTWCMCVVSVSSSSATAYVCQASGITTSTNITNHTSTIVDDINLGRDEIVGRFMSGSISQAMMFNRALSTAEIQQNFQATRGRYGL
jgi:hypothetical protein